MKISKVFQKVPSCFKEVSSVFQLCFTSDSGKIEKKLFPPGQPSSRLYRVSLVSSTWPGLLP